MCSHPRIAPLGIYKDQIISSAEILMLSSRITWSISYPTVIDYLPVSPIMGKDRSKRRENRETVLNVELKPKQM